MNNLITTFIERQGEWAQALLEHLQISLLALLLAVVIAVPVGVLLTRFPQISEPILHLTGIFQTIPSLALLGLFIPLMGIGTLPAVTALVIYALFPILQNTVTGINGIDQNLIEAATAFGMTHLERLKKFELALALPVIISGIRTATVLIIGTATLAALIGAGGLGTFILLGIDRNNASLIIIGAVSSALLAILFNIAIRWLERASFKQVILSFATLVVLLGASFAPTMVNEMMTKEIVVAGKLGPEPELLINMYKELIEEQSDIQVVLKPNFGKTSFLYEALKSKQIDLYPEFSGTITSSLLQNTVQVTNDPKAVYETARDEIYKQDKLIYLEPMAFQNTYAVAVKRSFAQEHQLQSISDLKTIEQQAVAGFTLEFNDREDGYRGLQSVYQLNLAVKTMEPALRYQAIAANDIQITDAYSTDSELKQFDLVVLTDDQSLFPPYQGAPLLREETLKRYPELQPILNQLAGKITAEEMSEMNYQVKIVGRSAQEVAHEFLIKNGLVND